ncbi:hypothetical protein WMF38_57005 [Sorangium sp. So ce118]
MASDRLALRAPVDAFSQTMESLLRENDHKGGWSECAPHWLLHRLCEELAELVETFDPGDHHRATLAKVVQHLHDAGWLLYASGLGLKPTNPKLTLSESGDVANFAMMIAEVCGGLKVMPGRPDVDREKRRVEHLDEMLCEATALIERGYEATGSPKVSDVPLDEEVRRMRCLLEEHGLVAPADAKETR